MLLLSYSRLRFAAIDKTQELFYTTNFRDANFNSVYVSHENRKKCSSLTHQITVQNHKCGICFIGFKSTIRFVSRCIIHVNLAHRTRFKTAWQVFPLMRTLLNDRTARFLIASRGRLTRRPVRVPHPANKGRPVG